MLRVENIVVCYGRAEAVRGVSFTAELGGITTLIGANGAGKTTCLKAISGLVPLTSGEIWFEGERIDGRTPEEIAGLGVAHVPEGRRIFPYMSVYDNLMTGAFLRKDKDGIEEDLEKVMEYFPALRSKLKQMARSLSGGEQQMLAFGRAFLLKPKLFILDEPSLGLAPLLVEAMGRYIKQFAEDGYSIILVEQNANMALSIAQRAYVLESGEVVLEGNAEDLKVDEHVRKFYLLVNYED
jgi:branched-chain amino acid transport system ATP-binding protein